MSTWQGIPFWSPLLDVALVVAVGGLGTLAVLVIAERKRRRRRRETQRFLDRLNGRSERYHRDWREDL